MEFLHLMKVIGSLFYIDISASRGTIDLHCINLQLLGYGTRPSVILQPPVVLIRSIAVGQVSVLIFQAHIYRQQQGNLN